MADPKETQIAKAIETALSTIVQGASYLGVTMRRTPVVRRAVQWEPSMLSSGEPAVYVLSPADTLDQNEVASFKLRNQMPLVLTLAASQQPGEDFQANAGDRWDAATECFDDIRARLMYAYKDPSGELKGLVKNIEFELEYGAKTEALASWSIAYVGLLVTYEVQFS